MRPGDALASIEALCDAADADRERHLATHPEDEGVLHASIEVDDVRAILADVQPRYWLPTAVGHLVDNYRAGDMNGVHRIITEIVNRDYRETGDQSLSTRA